MEERAKKLKLNTISSFLLQFVTIICGFILPRLILQRFGSDVNGLVNSISQFLNLIAFLELGVGAVVQSSLYKPLAEGDNDSVSKIYVSAGKFFRVLACILLAYVITLLFIFPNLESNNFDWIYTDTLIGAICISYFAQYYFGIVDRLLLTADQRGYIQYFSQICTLILNTVSCVILINTGATIQIVKLVSSLIFLARPLVIRIIVNRKYNLNRRIKYSGEPIKQKWNGVAQHVAAIVLDNTDTIVLTIFSTLSNVSIYGVYNLVINGVKQLFTSLTSGVQALIGELWAKQELEALKSLFSKFEWIVHTSTVFLFGCTASLIVPFVQVYTAGVNDVNYIVPLFALLITLANGLHCLRLPYNIMILAAGHYKQTQHNYIIAAVMNIVVSIAVVKWLGLIGVAIGTICAMTYQTVWMAYYNSRNFIHWPFKRFVKQILIDTLEFSAAFIFSKLIPMLSVSVFSWIILAVENVLLWIIVIVAINIIFYQNNMKNIIGVLFAKVKNKL